MNSGLISYWVITSTELCQAVDVMITKLFISDKILNLFIYLGKIWPFLAIKSNFVNRLASADHKDAFGIVVSYSVKVKLFLGALGGEVTAELPFILMHPKVI